MLWYGDEAEPATNNHNWHVHVSTISEGACGSAGGHYNPFNIDVASAVRFSNLPSLNSIYFLFLYGYISICFIFIFIVIHLHHNYVHARFLSDNQRAQLPFQIFNYIIICRCTDFRTTRHNAARLHLGSVNSGICRANSANYPSALNPLRLDTSSTTCSYL